MSNIRDFMSEGFSILSVNFIDEADPTAVEIVYIEARDQTQHAGLMKNLALDTKKFRTSVQQLHDEIVSLLQEGLEEIRINRSE
jgi:hypothetical protein